MIAWGSSDHGGDSSSVQGQLRSVQKLQAARNAFAAIREDGSVVAWGDPENGGDCSGVQDQLRRVQQVQATLYAFAAILDDGSVVTWGNPAHGGDSSAVKGQLKNVQQVRLHRLPCRRLKGWFSRDVGNHTAGGYLPEDSICFFRKMPPAWCVNPSMFRVTVTVPSAIHTIPLVVIDAPSILEMTGAPKGCCLD